MCIFNGIDYPICFCCWEFFLVILNVSLVNFKFHVCVIKSLTKDQVFLSFRMLFLFTLLTPRKTEFTFTLAFGWCRLGCTIVHVNVHLQLMYMYICGLNFQFMWIMTWLLLLLWLLTLVNVRLRVRVSSNTKLYVHDCYCRLSTGLQSQSTQGSYLSDGLLGIVSKLLAAIHSVSTHSCHVVYSLVYY